jgi:hypothetical protein
MWTQPDQHAIHQELDGSVSRAYSTALALLGDANQAEALVVQAVEGLDPANVTSKAIRDAVVGRLVEAQMTAAASRPQSP